MGLATKGVTFTGNKRKGDKRVSTNISQFRHSARREGPVVRVQILNSLPHTSSLSALAYFSSYHLSQSVVILLNHIPLLNCLYL